MGSVLLSLVERCGGVVTRAVAAQVVPGSTLRGACHAGRLVRVLPEVYVDARQVPPGVRGQPALARLSPELRRRAVLAYTDGRGALSSLTALEVWGLRAQTAGEPLHLDVPADSGIRSRPHLVVHHRLGFAVAPPHVVTRNGTPVVRLERALVDAWPDLPAVDRPDPLIRAVNDRLTTPERLHAALEAAPRLARRADLRTLLAKLAAGCRSPLEIWGHDHVFTGPGMPAFARQVRIQARRRTMYLDVYAERERVDFELDGAPMEIGGSAKSTCGGTRCSPRWASWWSGSRIAGSCTRRTRCAARSGRSSPAADSGHRPTDEFSGGAAFYG